MNLFFSRISENLSLCSLTNITYKFIIISLLVSDTTTWTLKTRILNTSVWSFFCGHFLWFLLSVFINLVENKEVIIPFFFLFFLLTSLSSYPYKREIPGLGSTRGRSSGNVTVNISFFLCLFNPFSWTPMTPVSVSPSPSIS